MILQVDPGAALPVYEQIREQVVRMAVAGTLTPGTRLPTIRQLASDLRLAKGTVAKAYALLEEAAVIETRGRLGSFVLPPPEPAPIEGDEALARQLADAADAYVVAARQLGVDRDTCTGAVGRAWDRL